MGIILALLSSFKNQALDSGLIAFGEVGLSGEVRGVSMAAQRVAEAAKLGFNTCIIPKVCMEDCSKYCNSMKIVGVNTLSDVIDYCF